MFFFLRDYFEKRNQAVERFIKPLTGAALGLAHGIGVDSLFEAALANDVVDGHVAKVERLVRGAGKLKVVVDGHGSVKPIDFRKPILYPYKLLQEILLAIVSIFYFGDYSNLHSAAFYAHARSN